MADHVRGVLNQCDTSGNISGARVLRSGSQRGNITQIFHILSLQIHGGGIPRGEGSAAHCDLCGMHIPAGRIISHRKMERYNKNTQMR